VKAVRVEPSKLSARSAISALVFGRARIYLLEWRSRVRVAFALDCRDREAIGWAAGVSGF
jgi:hypothetical protein